MKKKPSLPVDWQARATLPQASSLKNGRGGRPPSPDDAADAGDDRISVAGATESRGHRPAGYQRERASSVAALHAAPRVDASQGEQLQPELSLLPLAAWQNALARAFRPRLPRQLAGLPRSCQLVQLALTLCSGRRLQMHRSMYGNVPRTMTPEGACDPLALRPKQRQFQGLNA